MNYDAKVKELFPYANDLARIAGVAYPRNNESAGAVWLYRIRDYMSEDWERILGSDEPTDEIEWDAVETSRYQQWLIFADLGLWDYDADVTYSETAEFPARNFRKETLRAVKVDDLPSLAERLLEEVANSVWAGILFELQKHAEDDEE